MSRVSRATSPFLDALHLRHLLIILFCLSMFCCTITWGSSAAKPTVVFSMPAPSFWPHGAAVGDDIDFEELDMDASQFEILRMDRVHLAIRWAECLANDWPELDLQWCLADWHDGKLVADSR
ncbi:hypothetical protein BR93DRAFT_927309 [Coniochaeta sp. PMI_546]|nr:hypothetical protein BR93DRAFT_927309 [Coniochaeta sp. PMI_546]